MEDRRCCVRACKVSPSAETKLFLHSKKIIHLFSFLLKRSSRYPASRIDRSPCFVKRPSIGSFNSFISSKHLHLPCSSSAETEGMVCVCVYIYIYVCTLINSYSSLLLALIDSLTTGVHTGNQMHCTLGIG